MQRLLRWKAGAVCALLERRCGTEPFQKLVAGLANRAARAAQALLPYSRELQAWLEKDEGEMPRPPNGEQAAGGIEDVATAALRAALPAGAPPATAPLLLATDAFLSACAKVGGLEGGEIAALAARNVKSSGSATLDAAYYYCGGAGLNGVDVALRMEGPPGAQAAARSAWSAGQPTTWRWETSSTDGPEKPRWVKRKPPRWDCTAFLPVPARTLTVWRERPARDSGPG